MRDNAGLRGPRSMLHPGAHGGRQSMPVAPAPHSQTRTSRLGKHLLHALLGFGVLGRVRPLALLRGPAVCAGQTGAAEAWAGPCGLGRLPAHPAWVRLWRARRVLRARLRAAPCSLRRCPLHTCTVPVLALLARASAVAISISLERRAGWQRRHALTPAPVAQAGARPLHPSTRGSQLPRTAAPPASSPPLHPCPCSCRRHLR